MSKKLSLYLCAHKVVMSNNEISLLRFRKHWMWRYNILHKGILVENLHLKQLDPRYFLSPKRVRSPNLPSEEMDVCRLAL